MRYILFLLTFILAASSTISRSIYTNIPTHKNIIVETATDSTKPLEQLSIKEKLNAHIIHFTGAVMSDTFVLTHFSRAFVADQYSDFHKPGKYSNGIASLPKSIATSLDGIAIPEKTRLVVYNNLNLKGDILIDVTGPAIINNSSFESSDFYAVANKKNYSRELQEIFPQKLRRWSGSGTKGMSNWVTFSFEILVVN